LALPEHIENEGVSLRLYAVVQQSFALPDTGDIGRRVHIFLGGSLGGVSLVDVSGGPVLFSRLGTRMSNELKGAVVFYAAAKR
jgi:hypothetical protein